MNKTYLFDTPPTWLAKAIAYQIFPDRFRRSASIGLNSQLALKPWDSDPKEQGFQGGDLYGVINELDYLQNLGITCIYLTPIFSSAANHRYHTYDYFQVDPILGGNKALDTLIQCLHERDMKLILDGVFNHCGRGFWAFHHLVENGKNSPYLDWFTIHRWPIKPYPEEGEDCGYSCWWNDPALPKFNHKNSQVREYLTSVAMYWIRKGIDGWRLDVPNEVPLDFWATFRREVKSINSEAWIIGEIWGDARTWLKDRYFDGVMNYRIGWSSLSWAGKDQLATNYINPNYPIKKINSQFLVDILETTFGWYSREVNHSQLNLLDSHDVPRALHSLGNDVKALKIALLILFLLPGVPCIYYGTEAGLCGGAEPECREAMPSIDNFDLNLYGFIRSLIALRKNTSCLFENEYRWQSFGEDALLAWRKESIDFNEDKEILILAFINRSRNSWLKIPGPHDFVNPLFLCGEIELNAQGLAPQSAVLFRTSLDYQFLN